MFTGIIEDIGIVKSITNDSLTIKTELKDIKIGDSIAVNGVCFTVVSINNEELSFDYSPNTDKLTNLALIKANEKVNLERALTLFTRIGGHLVSGHVEGTAKIEKIEKLQRFFKISFTCSKSILKYCVDRGSIAIDGISLTIASVNSLGFDVYIIPQTFNNTVMSLKKVGNTVNIETDILMKYIEQIEYSKKSGDRLKDTLKQNGFI
jgi:riboflavin synthase